MDPKVKTVAILAGVMITALLAIGGIFLIFAQLAEETFVPGEAVYLRDVYMVVDQTLSMGNDQRREAKTVAQQEVLSALGLGDRAFCYRIADNFSETHDRVFASQRNLPRVWQNVAGRAAGDLPAELQSQLNALWQRFYQHRSRWEKNLLDLESPPNLYSDYVGTISEIGARISNTSDPNLGNERWLVVIGDLKHEPVTDVPPPPAADERRQFSDVRIYLVHPGGIFDDREQERIERYWQRYFTARGNPKINVLSFDAFIGHFPASRVPLSAIN